MPARNITETRESIRNLQNELAQAQQRGRQLANDPNAGVADMEAQAENISRLHARIRLMEQDVEDEESARSDQVAGNRNSATRRDHSPADDGRSERLRDLVGSREYARAFATAIRSGADVRQGRNDENLRVLYDALTEAGGTPEGSEGGFLVPEDIDYTIRETRRELITLSALFDVQNVNTNKGSRTKDEAPNAGFTKLDGEIPEDGVPQDDQPKFSRVPYTLDTYGLNIPISNELAADEVSGLFAYLGRFFARKHVLTENKLLIGLLNLLTPRAFTPTETKNAVGEIKTILNKVLDPAISVSATIITNQSGFDYLDQLEDKQGRPLLQPDPSTGTPMILKTRRVVMASDALLPLLAGNALPFYIGDMTQYGTLFMRQPLEIASTNVGGKAWGTYSTEVRGITRLGVRTFDTKAASLLSVAPETEG